MTPIEGGARKRCVKHPSTSLRLSSAGPRASSLKNSRHLLFVTCSDTLIFTAALFCSSLSAADARTCNLSLENKWSALSASA